MPPFNKCCTSKFQNFISAGGRGGGGGGLLEEIQYAPKNLKAAIEGCRILHVLLSCLSVF